MGRIPCAGIILLITYQTRKKTTLETSRRFSVAIIARFNEYELQPGVTGGISDLWKRNRAAVSVTPHIRLRGKSLGILPASDVVPLLLVRSRKLDKEGLLQDGTKEV